MLLLYVNDMICFGDDMYNILEFKSCLSKYFEIKNLERLVISLDLEVSS